MRWISSAVAVAGLAVVMAGTAPNAAQDACLHGPDGTPEQADRRKQAVGFAREVNNQQSAARRSPSKAYAPLDQLKLSRSAPEGFELKLTTDGKAYAFSLVDTTDPCRFGLFSNEVGVIFKGEALR